MPTMCSPLALAPSRRVHFVIGTGNATRCHGDATVAAGRWALSPEGRPMGETETAESIAELRREIDRLDNEILRLVRQRSEVSRRIGAARMAAGGTKIVYNRELQVLEHYGQLGKEGVELAMVLLRLGRGRPGHR